VSLRAFWWELDDLTLSGQSANGCPMVSFRIVLSFRELLELFIQFLQTITITLSFCQEKDALGRFWGTFLAPAELILDR
jgi:hypothetical protein